MGAKIRNAEINKVPIMIILGEKELGSETVSIRRKFEGNQGSMKLNLFMGTLWALKNCFFIIEQIIKFRF